MADWNDPRVWTVVDEDGQPLPLEDPDNPKYNFEALIEAYQEAWEIAHCRVRKIWSLLRPAGIYVPADPFQFMDLLFPPNRARTQLMLYLLKKVYPSTTFYEEPVVAEPGKDLLETVHLWRLKKCIKICKWFGISFNRVIIEGSALESDEDEIYDLWFKIIKSVLDVRTQQRSMSNTIVLPTCDLLSDFLQTEPLRSWADSRRHFRCAAPVTKELVYLCDIFAKTGCEMVYAYRHLVQSENWFDVSRARIRVDWRNIVVGLYPFLDGIVTQAYIRFPRCHMVYLRKNSIHRPRDFSVFQARQELVYSNACIVQFLRCVREIGSFEEIVQRNLARILPPGFQKIQLTPEYTACWNSEQDDHYEPEVEELEPEPIRFGAIRIYDFIEGALSKRRSGSGSGAIVGVEPPEIPGSGTGSGPGH